MLRVSFLPDAGWGKVQELRDAITRFRKSGKPAYAHLEFCGQQGVLPRHAPAPRSTRSPPRILDVTGLAAEVTFFARHPRQARACRRSSRASGKYKNAPNQFTETRLHGAAPRADGGAARQPLRAVRRRHRARRATRRAEEVQAIIDAGPYDGADRARRPGSSTSCSTRTSSRDRLKDAESVDPGRYAKGRRAGSASTAGRRSRSSTRWARSSAARARRRRSAAQVAGSDTVAAALREAREDDVDARPSSCAWTARAARAPPPT